VIIAWNVFQHFYPYFDVVRVDWDQVLTAALQKALEDRNARDFDGTLRRMVAALHDGHGRVVDQNETSRPGYPPWLVEMIEGRVVVTASVVPAKLRPGDIVVAIDGEPVSTVIARLENERSGSPQWRRFLALRELGQGDPGSAARLGIVRRGVQLTVDVQRLDRPALLEFERPARQRLPGGVEYVDLTRTTTEQISADMVAIASAPGVVFDLRGYPKPSPDFLEHLLTEKDTSGAWMQVPEIIRPDQERISGWQREGWGLAPRAPRISGRVAFITGPMAVSYAESILSIVEHYRLGAIVGQATAGTNGNINPFLLPGGFKVFWTGMRVVKHDGSQHHLIGIQPTVPVARTLAGVLAHRDELLEVALRLVSPSTIR
jgi:C-terminal processing protease CtpA/Prc